MKRYANLPAVAAVLAAAALALLTAACAEASDRAGVTIAVANIEISGVATEVQTLIDELEAGADASAEVKPEFDKIMAAFGDATKARNQVQDIPAAEFSAPRYRSAVAGIDGPIPYASSAPGAESELQITITDEELSEPLTEDTFFMSKGNALAVLNALIREYYELEKALTIHLPD